VLYNKKTKMQNAGPSRPRNKYEKVQREKKKNKQKIAVGLRFHEPVKTGPATP
jgi:hypothetical protein